MKVIICLSFPLIINNVLRKLVVPIVKNADYDNIVPSQSAMLADVLLLYSYPNSFSRWIKFYPCIPLSYKILSISFFRSYLTGLNSSVNSNYILRKLPAKDLLFVFLQHENTGTIIKPWPIPRSEPIHTITFWFHTPLIVTYILKVYFSKKIDSRVHYPLK